MPRDSELGHLHPLMREKSVALEAALLAEGIPLKRYETGRSPQRQADLFLRGRALPGSKVTNAGPWDSFHNHGFAEDNVFLIGGRWSWAEPTQGMWAKYQQLAVKVGLRVLSFEKPHVELALTLADLRRGVYPAGGDASWSEWLETQCETWGLHNRTVRGFFFHGAPPLTVERPALVA